MAVDFKNEILKILDEIKNNREKIEQYEIFGSIFNNVEKEQYSRLIDSSYSIKIEGIVNLQEDVNVENLLNDYKNLDKKLFFENSKILREYLKNGSSQNVARIIQN